MIAGPSERTSDAPHANLAPPLVLVMLAACGETCPYDDVVARLLAPTWPRPGSYVQLARGTLSRREKRVDAILAGRAPVGEARRRELRGKIDDDALAGGLASLAKTDAIGVVLVAPPEAAPDRRGLWTDRGAFARLRRCATWIPIRGTPTERARLGADRPYPGDSERTPLYLRGAATVASYRRDFVRFFDTPAAESRAK